MSAVPQSSPSIEVFFSYSREDEPLRNKLENHLSELWRRGVLSWHDRKIGAGTEWAGRIDEHLDSAQIILLLISSDFLASSYCHVEMKRALERHERREARVIPILLRPVAHWEKAPFHRLQVLPANGIPVTSFENPEEAYAAIAEAVIDAVDDLLGDEESRGPARPRVPVRRRRAGWLLTAAGIAIVAVALIAFGIRARTQRLPPPPTAAPAVSTLAEKERLNLAFAVGSSIAMAGQSTHTVAEAMFERALTDLAVPPDTVRQLDRAYGEVDRAALAGTLGYDELEARKAELMKRIAAPLTPSDTAALELGHDATALLLLVRFWSQYPSDEEALSVARDRVERLQASARDGLVPPAVADRLRAIDDVNLIQAKYRRDTERLLDDAVRYFDMKPRQ
jgi:hypothetical protein